jgi:uncharacterized membrane protein YdjX (TVP38/TMEM64 family)
MVAEPERNASVRRTAAGIGRVALLGLLVALVVLFFLLDLGRFLDLAYLRSVHAETVAWVRVHPVLATMGYFAAYVVVTGLSLPGAAVLTIAGGAVFGLLWGTAIVSFASTVGATLAMLIARRLLGEWVQRRFALQLRSVNEGLRRDGGFYLFSLRMVPVFPFVVINLVVGVSPMRVWTFYWVSQLGMLPGTLVFVFAGTQLASISSPGDILTPGMILALSLLGVFPLVARKALAWLRRHRKPAAGAR